MIRLIMSYKYIMHTILLVIIYHCFISSSVFILSNSLSLVSLVLPVFLLCKLLIWVNSVCSMLIGYCYLGLNIFLSAIFFWRKNTPLPGFSETCYSDWILTRNEICLLKILEESLIKHHEFSFLLIFKLSVSVLQRILNYLLQPAVIKRSNNL
jgi:hypothetical protein